MDLFDFYKLLNIPVGTAIEDVKKAYILKIHEVSGAYKEGNEKADEFLGIINQGYQLLSDPQRKRVYDLMLLNYYLKQRSEDINRMNYRKYGRSKRNPTVDGNSFENNASEVFPTVSDSALMESRRGVRLERAQLLLACTLILALFVVYDYIFWKPYSEFKVVAYVFLAVSYLMLMVWTMQKIARFFEVRSVLWRNKRRLERPVLIAFLILFFALPSLASKGETWRREYHMKLYGKIANPLDFKLEDEWLTVDYKVEGQPYKQSISLGESVEHFRKNNYDTRKFKVRYSAINPSIMEVVLLPSAKK